MRRIKFQFSSKLSNILVYKDLQVCEKSIQSEDIKGQLGSVKDKYLNNFYQSILTNILQTHDEKQIEINQYIFQKEGKLIRPLLNLILFDFLNQKWQFSDYDKLLNEQITWSQCIEIMHVSSLVHDDILDNSMERRGQPCVHQKFGKNNAIFGANFLVGRSGRKLQQFQNVKMFQIFSNIMDQLTSGEYIQARKNKNIKDKDKIINDYLLKTYYKTASLTAYSSKGVGFLCGLEDNDIENCYKIGQHLGMSFQLIDDAMDYTMTKEQLGKQNLADLKEGHLTAPILLILDNLSNNNNLDKSDYEQLYQIVQKKEVDDEDLVVIQQIINFYDGIKKTNILAKYHLQQAVHHSQSICQDTDNQKIKALGNYFIQRTN